MIISGIDEAGRGPAIGPLVIAVAAIEENDLDKLKILGVKDSKLLSEKQRETIFKELEKTIRYEIIIVDPEEIDQYVFRGELNKLEADKGISILNKLDVKLDNEIKKAIADCPSTNTESYKKYLKSILDNQEIELIVEHKADLNYLIVGAASILAKVTRDRVIEKIKHKFKVDFGSGYPSDPKTKEFVTKNCLDQKFDKIFRKSWGTYKDAINKKSQKNMLDF